MTEAKRAPRFGVEEEFLLLDAETGRPRDGSDAIIAALPELRAEHEFFHSQLETATPICDTADEAIGSLREFRVAASREARRNGLVLSGAGLPPLGGEIPGTVVDTKRYVDINRTMRGMVSRYYSTGTHVHVEVPSRDAGIDAVARIAPWTPLLIALTANSPVWLGDETGYASWRYLSLQQWPSSGYPPHFASAEEYDRVVDGLVDAGALLDRALVNWSIRLSAKFPTIEIRLADAQLSSEEAVAYALIYRALVARALREGAAGTEFEPAQPDILRGASWLAARNGLASELVDPRTWRPGAAAEVLDALLDHVGEDLSDAGDLARVEGYLAARKRDGGPAERQLAAWRAGGIAGLLGVYDAAGD
ncbi:YbdK family carboxylate-amine ligase [Leucobacter sp. CSA2]|uniref:Putative glutamate--cysteine ligase 2 n=1 Tax=Leucobacter edaphi TaxID=2796472 RepID=A0A934QF00_9MICO|nr:YbdK family carboxylate-amine ligase [Leucobacter edaphi]